MLNNNSTIVKILMSPNYLKKEEKYSEPIDLKKCTSKQADDIINLIIDNLSTMDDKQKAQVIEKLNLNFSTVVSYGLDNGMVPIGEFKVADLLFNKTEDGKSSELAEVVLEKKDDNNVKIVLPLVSFIKMHEKLAEKNTDKFDIGSNLSLYLEKIMNKATLDVIYDEKLERLIEADMVSLENVNGSIIWNGKEGGVNYSLCPVELGKYREICKVFDDHDER